MIEKIISKLQEAREEENVPSNKSFWTWCDAVAKCEEIVQEVAKEYGNGWIPCSERLPEDKHSVLVTTKNGTIWTAFYNEDYDEWLDDIDEGPLSVIAWQPLPAPYKSEV